MTQLYSVDLADNSAMRNLANDLGAAARRELYTDLRTRQVGGGQEQDGRHGEKATATFEKHTK